jgi:hypothetical protein
VNLSFKGDSCGHRQYGACEGCFRLFKHIIERERLKERLACAKLAEDEERAYLENSKGGTDAHATLGDVHGALACRRVADLIRARGGK